MLRDKLVGLEQAMLSNGDCMKRLSLSLLLAMSFAAVAAEPDATTRAEIAHLIAHLETSGCQFNRNGTWYEAARAVSHLNGKYEYLLKKNLVPSAEAFIERAASESSATGKPYLVKCGEQPKMESAIWFRTALAKRRSQSGHTR